MIEFHSRGNFNSRHTGKGHLLVKIAAVTVVTVDSQVYAWGGAPGGREALSLACIVLAARSMLSVEFLLANVKCSVLFVNLLVPECMLNARGNARLLDWLWKGLVGGERRLLAAEDLFGPCGSLWQGVPQVREGLLLSVLLISVFLVLVHHFVV